jgi:hypothetical protein
VVLGLVPAEAVDEFLFLFLFLFLYRPAARAAPAVLRRLTPGNVSFLSEVFRLRLRALRAVDELVEALGAARPHLGGAHKDGSVFSNAHWQHQSSRLDSDSALAVRASAAARV